eukprot:CAMPEP_0180809924 /NCGR_PEP_ID=MMETSP1038_2-20121128/64590_1 /TAXON_ID=632150 /ORGANISM="Azadinium spinosum, Strain 3D9" /LENGTH=62 /DNA_ID=CAMNT_0022851139 /DNA_START=130 /DNA_END=318 /DNA_ORIENTATION=-
MVLNSNAAVPSSPPAEIRSSTSTPEGTWCRAQLSPSKLLRVRSASVKVAATSSACTSSGDLG